MVRPSAGFRRAACRRIMPGMLLKRATLEAIAAGEVDLQLRVWKRPTVRAGGSLKTSVGVLAILAVERTTPAEITDEVARRAGFSSAEALLETLAPHREGDLYRIELRLEGPDPRIALRERPLAEDGERHGLSERLRRMDGASTDGPWTEAYLRLIGENEGVRAPELAAKVGLETSRFKDRVRRLKALGLTESLRVGYRLSPRGRSYLEGIR